MALNLPKSSSDVPAIRAVSAIKAVSTTSILPIFKPYSEMTKEELIAKVKHYEKIELTHRRELILLKQTSQSYLTNYTKIYEKAIKMEIQLKAFKEIYMEQKKHMVTLAHTVKYERTQKRKREEELEELRSPKKRKVDTEQDEQYLELLKDLGLDPIDFEVGCEDQMNGELHLEDFKIEEWLEEMKQLEKKQVKEEPKQKMSCPTETNPIIPSKTCS